MTTRRKWSECMAIAPISAGPALAADQVFVVPARARGGAHGRDEPGGATLGGIEQHQGPVLGAVEDKERTVDRVEIFGVGGERNPLQRAGFEVERGEAAVGGDHGGGPAVEGADGAQGS